MDGKDEHRIRHELHDPQLVGLIKKLAGEGLSCNKIRQKSHAHHKTIRAVVKQMKEDGEYLPRLEQARNRHVQVVLGDFRAERGNPYHRTWPGRKV